MNRTGPPDPVASAPQDSQFSKLPIRRKLLLITLASSVAALVVASGGFLIWDVFQFTVEMQQDIRAQSRILAESAERHA